MLPGTKDCVFHTCLCGGAAPAMEAQMLCGRAASQELTQMEGTFFGPLSFIAFFLSQVSFSGWNSSDHLRSWADIEDGNQETVGKKELGVWMTRQKPRTAQL